MRVDLGLLFLRVFAGGTMLLSHGIPKFMKFAQLAERFPDPLGVGSKFSLVLAVFAEVVCAVLLILGLATRLASVPLLSTMIVAFFVVHALDPFAQKELAFLYGAIFLALAVSGPGNFSLDQIRKGRR